MKRNRESSAHIFINLILPYACVLLVPILIWWISNFYVIQNNENRMLELVKSGLENNINMVDTKLSQVEEVIYRMSLNESVARFFEKESLTFSETKEYQNLLSSYFLDDGLTDRLYMYNSRAGFLTDPANFFSNEEAFVVSYASTELATQAERIADLKEKARLNGYGKPTSYMIDREEYLLLPYSRTMPIHHPNRQEGNITVLINVDKLISYFDASLAKNNGELYVFTNSGELVMSRGESCRDLAVPGEKRDNFFKKVKVNGKKLYQFTLTSPQKKWEYHIFIDQQAIMQDMSVINGVLSAVNILAFVLGCLLCIYFTYGRNKSYLRLMHMLGIDKKNLPISTLKTNEFEFWKPYIGNLLDENRQIKENMDKLSDQSDYKVLHLLLSDHSGDEAVAKRLLQDSNLNFSGRFFAVLVLRSAAVYNIEGESNKNIFLTHALKDFIEEQLHIYIADAKTLVALINFDEAPAAFFRRLKKRLVNMNLEVFYRYRMEVLLGVGKATDRLCGISESYDCAKEVIFYSQMTGTKDKLFYEELPLEQTMYYYPIELENSLITAISAGKAAEASKILNTIYEENFSKRSLSGARMEELLREIDSSLNKVRQTYFKDEECIHYRLEDFTIKSFFEYAQDFVFAACENMKVFEENAHNAQFKEMLEYIQEHYDRNDLSRDTLAAHFGLTDNTYISKMFKKFMNENFSSYLERIRMEKACDLLDSRMPVKDVAEQVGYLSDVSFRRAFKKRMGMSPLEYVNQQKR